MFTNPSNRSIDSRIGQPWSNEEDKQLLEEIGVKLDISEIASTHKRTVKGIKLRLIHNAIQAIEKGLFDVEHAATHYGISQLDIKEQQEKKVKEIRISTFKENQPVYHEKYLELLTEIRDSLKVLTQHICSQSIAQSIQQQQQQQQHLENVAYSSNNIVEGRPKKQETVSAPPSPLKPIVKIIKKTTLPTLKTSESMPSLPLLSQQTSLKGQQSDDHETLTMPFPKLKVEVP